MNKFGLASMVSGALVLAGCGGSSSSSDTEENAGNQTQLSVPFAAMVGSDPVTCGTTYQSLGTAGTDVTFSDFRFFIHDLALVTDQGDVLPVELDSEAFGQNDRVALLDFRDTAAVGEANAISDVCAAGSTDANPFFKDSVQASVNLDPAVSITSIRFTLGVPFDLNHANQSAAEEPLRNPGLADGMTWNWKNGYKFFAADVSPDGGITRPGTPEYASSSWNNHLGSTGCEVEASDLENGVEPETCPNENRIEVTLPLGGISLSDAAIQIDYQALVSGSNLGQDNGGAPGCMSGPTDPECEAIFERLALPWGGEANSGGNPNEVVFSVVQQ